MQSEELIALVRREYRFASESVVPHLLRNTDVAWMLLEAKKVLEESFGALWIEITLRIVRDPEDDEGNSHEQLFGYIRTDLTSDDALGALDRFDQSWFLDNVNLLAGRLNFDLSF